MIINLDTSNIYLLQTQNYKKPLSIKKTLVEDKSRYATAKCQVTNTVSRIFGHICLWQNSVVGVLIANLPGATFIVLHTKATKDYNLQKDTLKRINSS